MWCKKLKREKRAEVIKAKTTFPDGTSRLVEQQTTSVSSATTATTSTNSVNSAPAAAPAVNKGPVTNKSLEEGTSKIDFQLAQLIDLLTQQKDIMNVDVLSKTLQVDINTVTKPLLEDLCTHIKKPRPSGQKAGIDEGVKNALAALLSHQGINVDPLAKQKRSFRWVEPKLLFLPREACGFPLCWKYYFERCRSTISYVLD